jgi:hypothetical protein
MPDAVFLPAYHDDDDLFDVVRQALAVRPGALKLYARPDDCLLAWLPRLPRQEGWVQVSVPALPDAPHLPEAA